MDDSGYWLRLASVVNINKYVATPVKAITPANKTGFNDSLRFLSKMPSENVVKSNAKKPAYKRLAKKLAPDANIALLAKLFLADKRGRNPKKGTPLDCTFDEVETFIKNAQNAKVEHNQEPPLLTGKDFLDVVEPGPKLGEVVKKAYELQLDGLNDKNELKKEELRFFEILIT